MSSEDYHHHHKNEKNKDDDDNNESIPPYLRKSFTSSFPQIDGLKGSNSRFYRLDYVTAMDAINRETMRQQSTTAAEYDNFTVWEPVSQQPMSYSSGSGGGGGGSIEALSPEERMEYERWLQENAMKEQMDRFEQMQHSLEMQERGRMDIDMYRFLNVVAEQCMRRCFILHGSHSWRPESLKVLKKERECVRWCAQEAIKIKLQAVDMRRTAMQQGLETTIFGSNTPTASIMSGPGGTGTANVAFDPFSRTTGGSGGGSGGGGGGGILSNVRPQGMGVMNWASSQMQDEDIEQENNVEMQKDGGNEDGSLV